MEKPVSVAIIGAGFAGLGAAIRLLENGIDDIVVLERAERAGGTWRDNTYPGAACDIPSNLYSYSFAPNPHWSRGYSGSREILGYIDNLVERWRLNRFIRYRSNVDGLSFDAASGLWQVRLGDGGTVQARAVVMASGPLSNVSLPKMPGIESYEGHKVHSARWDHGYDFRGKRVAVIGTGASAVQIVPELVKQADRLKVFQRTPGWVLPRLDYATADWNRSLFRRFPGAQQAVRDALYWGHETMALGVVWTTPMTRVLEQASRLYLQQQVKDAWLRRQLTPDYRIGCKRILMTSDYLPALQQPNCELITWPIATLSPKGIRTAEGVEHVVDCIVFATGFDVGKAGTPFPVTGLGGRRLQEEWARGVQAYKSVSVSGYPNLFLTFGPNSGPGHNSALVYLEAQLDYIVQGIRHLLAGPARFLDVRAPVQAAFNRTIQERLKTTNWNSGCRSWYLTEDGFNPTMYPGFATQFRRQMQRFDLQDYRSEPA
ncbi:MAG: flavin-containing monooxygenase [Pseudomonadota bacterium]